MSVLTSDIFSPQAISCLVVSSHSIKRLGLTINLLLTGMVLEVLKLEVELKFLLTLAYSELDSSKNSVVLLRQLQLRKKVKIYSESMDLLILELLQLFSVKVELYLELVEQQNPLLQIQKKGRFCSPLLELSQRNIHKIMLEKVYYSHLKLLLKNQYSVTLVRVISLDSIILKKQEYTITIVVLLSRIQNVIMVLSLIETILQLRRLEQLQFLHQRLDLQEQSKLQLVQR